MHKRIIPLLTAGALAISSLIVSTVSAQAEDPAASPATPAVQADNPNTPAPDNASTPAARDADTTTASISGKVIFPEGYKLMDTTGLTAYQIDDSTGTIMDDSYDWGDIALDGTYTIDGLEPGTHWIVVLNSQNLRVSPSNDFLSTAFGGYTANDSPYGWDLSDPNIQVVTAGQDGVDITMTVAPLVKGKVFAPGADQIFVSVCSVGTYQNLGGCSDTTAASDGSYSAPVVPGSTSVVYASAAGYLYTWLGGYAGGTDPFYSGLPSGSVTQIPPSSNGEPITVQDLPLVKAASFTGAVILPDGYTFQTMRTSTISAYPVDRSSGTPRVNGSPVTGIFGGIAFSDGSQARYLNLNTLVPGQEYLVVVRSSDLYIDQDNDFLTTSAGGYASTSSVSNWDLTRDDMGLVTATADSTPTVNVTMKKGDIVSGTITPNDAVNKTVDVCEVTGTGSKQSTTNCIPATVDAATGVYSVSVTPGATVALEAKANDYLFTWLGGYTSTYDSSYGNVNDQMTLVQAPASEQNIDLVKAVSISGTLTLPDGYKLSTDNPGNVLAFEVMTTDDGPYFANSYSGQLSSDGTYRISGLNPGSTYVVSVSPYNITLSQGDPLDLLTAVYDGYSTTYSEWDIYIPNPQITGITPLKDTFGVDLAMEAGGKITGTVYLPNGDSVTGGTAGLNVYCMSVSDFNTTGQRDRHSIDSNGSYSCTVVPGQPYVVYAEVDAYPVTWRGGFIGSNPTLPDKSVTEITVPSANQAKSGQDIYLAEGSSVTGKLIGYVREGIGIVVAVQACVLYPDGSTGDCRDTVTVDSEGNYTISGLVPGADTVVVASAYGYVDSWYGGYAGSPSLPNAKVTEFTSAAAGGNVPNIDITMVKPVTVTGSILPTSVVSDSGGLYVYACPVYTQGGQDYYRVNAPIFGQGSATLNNNTSSSVDEWCVFDWVPSSGTSYSLQLIPGVDYAIVGQADGYADSWYGGYSADSGIVNDVDSPDLPLPLSDQIQLISGTAGQTLTGKDIVFGASVTVTFDADGGTPATSTKSTAPRGTVVLPAPPTRTGYTFGGWYTAKNGAGTQFLATAAVPADITVYAKWTANEQVVTYTLKYDANGGSGTMGSATYSAGETATVAGNGFAKIGYTFVSWNTSADGKGTTYAPAASLTVTGDTTLYAQWALGAVPVYNVTFTDGQGHPITTVPVASGGAATAPADPTRVGYAFAGWDKAFDKVTSDLTVNATWTQLATYTLSFDGNGGTGSMSSLTGYDGDSVTIPANAFTLDGQILTGWNTQANGKGTPYPAGASVTLTGNVTLYAQWKVPAPFTVVFMDGQGNQLSKATVLEGSAATPPADPTRDGYTFSGWDTAFNDVRSDLTINAVWKSNTPDEAAGPEAPTGGTSAPASSGYLLVMAAGCVLAGLFVQRLSLVRSTKRG